MTLFLLALACLVGGGFLALATFSRPRLATACGLLGTLLGTGLALVPALTVLTGGASLACDYPWAVPAGSFTLLLDPLAAFFVLPIALLAFLCAIYATGYLKDYPRPRGLGCHWFFFNILVAGLLLVVTAANGVLFLAAWEIMTVGSFFLIALEHRQTEVREAAWLYLVLAHLALMLLFAFFVSAGAHCGSLAFADFAPLAQLPEGTATLLVALAVAGFGVKAGLFPLHVWLPDAHPAAPSHVSALMSGVVVKTGIYGILRVVGLLPTAAPEIGLVLMLLGGAGALYGIAMAMMQRDIKRCLAYSTVENIGIIFLALGLGLYADRNGQPALAALAFAGGLLHCWNHTLFKGLMFLGAGSLLHATGSRDMDQMGGLLKRMPWSGTLLIGGSLAIAALPPFNGLVSEWLLYLGLLKSGLLAEGFGGLVPLLLVGVLGLTGALALVAFTRLVGIALLGEPRSLAAQQAHEAAPSMLAPMVLLLLCCLAIGLLPHLALGLLAAPLAQLVPAGATLITPSLAPLAQFGRWGGGLLGGLGVVTLVLVWFIRHRPGAVSNTWGCGFAFPTARMAYTGAAYGELTQNHLLPAPLRPRLVDTPQLTGFFPRGTRRRQISLDPLLSRLYRPAVAEIAERCVRLRWLQQGRLPVYLFYIFVTCTVLMVWVILADHGWRGFR